MNKSLKMDIPKNFAKGNKKDLEERTRKLVEPNRLSLRERLRVLFKGTLPRKEQLEGKFLFEGEAYPRENRVTRHGYTMTVEFYGIYEEWKPLVAQAGDPKGSISLEGPYVKVTIGSKISPENLSKGKGLVNKLGRKIQNKYNRIINLDFLHELGEEAFKPYIQSYFK